MFRPVGSGNLLKFSSQWRAFIPDENLKNTSLQKALRQLVQKSQGCQSSYVFRKGENGTDRFISIADLNLPDDKPVFKVSKKFGVLLQYQGEYDPNRQERVIKIRRPKRIN
jgi:hypothetical protein